MDPQLGSSKLVMMAIDHHGIMTTLSNILYTKDKLPEETYYTISQCLTLPLTL